MQQSGRRKFFLVAILILTSGPLELFAQAPTAKSMRLGEIYDILRLDLPEEPIEKRNRTLVHGVNTRGIDFELTEAIAADLVKEGATTELIGAIRKVSDANRLAKNKIDARKHFQGFETCGKDDFDCKLASLDKAIALDPNEKLYSDWKKIVEEQRPKPETSGPARSTKGKKSGRVLYSSGYGTPTKLFEQFNSAFISRLKAASLELELFSSLQRGDRDKTVASINRKSRDEKGLQFLPYALIVNVTFTLAANLEDTYELKAFEVTGSIELIDTDTGKTVGFHSFERIRGFGATQEMAETNALRDAASRIPDSFIKEIVEKAR